MRRKIVLCAALSAVCGLAPAASRAQDASGVSGTWTYRSFRNDPTLVNGDLDKALRLIFGEGVLQITVEGDQAAGTLDLGSGYVLDLSGRLRRDAEGAASIALTGMGRPGTPTSGWVYDYQAFLAPTWPQGVNQRPALVGTVIRTAAHGGGAAGYTASFIAVKSAEAAISSGSFGEEMAPILSGR